MHMQALDLRKLAMGFSLKGHIAGSLRQVAADVTSARVCSVSLDRWLRVHDASTRSLLGKAYLKAQLTACIWATSGCGALQGCNRQEPDT